MSELVWVGTFILLLIVLIFVIAVTTSVLDRVAKVRDEKRRMQTLFKAAETKNEWLMKAVEEFYSESEGDSKNG